MTFVGVGEGVGDGAVDALGLGCGIGVGSVIGVIDGDGDGVLFGAAALELSFFTKTPLLQTNFPDFLMQVYW